MSTVLVTGANKGVGLEIVARLARTHPNNTILLGTRSVKNGQDAIKKLQERGIPTDKVKLLEIDVTSQDSVEKAAKAIRADYNGQLSAVYNNAGVADYKGDYKDAKTIMDVNYYGVKRVTKAFRSIIAKGGHNVVVSSGMGASATYASPPELQATLRTPQSEATIDALVERYLEALKSENKVEAAAREGFPDPSGFCGPYAMSKAFLNNYVQSTAPAELMTNGTILVAACPGYCATELNGNSGPRKAATGAWSIVSASQTSDKDAGGFFRDAQPAKYFDAPPSFEEMIEDAKQLEARLHQEGQLLD